MSTYPMLYWPPEDMAMVTAIVTNPRVEIVLMIDRPVERSHERLMLAVQDFYIEDIDWRGVFADLPPAPREPPAPRANRFPIASSYRRYFPAPWRALPSHAAAKRDGRRARRTRFMADIRNGR